MTRSSKDHLADAVEYRVRTLLAPIASLLPARSAAHVIEIVEDFAVTHPSMRDLAEHVDRQSARSDLGAKGETT